MTSYDFGRAKEYFLDKLSFSLGPIELRRRIDRGEELNIIDVRLAKDFEEGHIPGARNIPVNKQGGQYIWDDYSLLSETKINIVYCYTIVCHSSTVAAFEFASRGYRVMELDGGFETWKQKNLPIERKSCAIGSGAEVAGACNCG